MHDLTREVVASAKILGFNKRGSTYQRQLVGARHLLKIVKSRYGGPLILEIGVILDDGPPVHSELVAVTWHISARAEDVASDVEALRYFLDVETAARDEQRKMYIDQLFVEIENRFFERLKDQDAILAFAATPTIEGVLVHEAFRVFACKELDHQ